MADWKKRAQISHDVCFFEYVSSRQAASAPLVYIWDIDKTYLETHFDTLKGLWRTAMEKAFQKRNVPGTRSLVRALMEQNRPGPEKDPFPIYFITASPPQIEDSIRGKLELDGIKPYGVFCKDNLKNLKPSRLWRLTQQVGFKLQALLELRLGLAPEVQQILWGDDSESDAIIYSLYSDICMRRLSTNELLRILRGLHVTGEQGEIILRLQSNIPQQDPVYKIYINLATDTDPDYYVKFGGRTVPTYDSLQIALDLHQDSRLGLDQVIKVAQDLVTNYAFTPEEIASSFDDMIRRELLETRSVEEALPELLRQGLLPKYYLPRYKAPEKLNEDSGRIPEYIDYLHDFR